MEKRDKKLYVFLLIVLKKTILEKNFQITTNRLRNKDRKNIKWAKWYFENIADPIRRIGLATSNLFC
jgi:hypothetical protein